MFEIMGSKMSCNRAAEVFYDLTLRLHVVLPSGKSASFSEILQSRGLEDFHQDLIGAGLLKASHRWPCPGPPEKPASWTGAGSIERSRTGSGDEVCHPLLVVRALVCKIN